MDKLHADKTDAALQEGWHGSRPTNFNQLRRHVIGGISPHTDSQPLMQRRRTFHHQQHTALREIH